MVLEHLHQPKLALEKLRHSLRPDGWLAISVPNAASLESRFFKENWYALDLPRHLFHFTPATVRTLLSASGWEIRRILHQRLLGNLIGSVGYVLRERNTAPSLARHLIEFPDKAGRQNQLLYPLALLFSAFGQTGRMTVWAQPTSGSTRD
jgi:SAM-dependent methyltransferase